MVKKTAAETVDAPAEETAEAAPDTRSSDAAKLVGNYASATAALGLVPIPLVDAAAIAAAQYKMIGELARLYGQDVSQERARAALVSVLGGGVPTLLNGSALGSLVKAVPGVGPLLALAFLPAMAGATTMAVGRVFADHFEAGGTLSTLDAASVRAHVRAELEALRSKKAPAGPAGAEPAAA